MSDTGRERKPKRPPTPAPGDDPWARWRKPETPATPPAERVAAPRASSERRVGGAGAVDGEKPAELPPTPERPPAAAVRERPTGTLSPIKPAAPARGKATKTPFRKASAAPSRKSPDAAALPPRAPAPQREPAAATQGGRLSKWMSAGGMYSRRDAALWI